MNPALLLFFSPYHLKSSFLQTPPSSSTCPQLASSFCCPSFVLPSMHLYWLPAGTCSAGKHVALTSSDTRNTCGSVWVATVPHSRASWIKYLCLVHVHHTVRYRQKHGYSHPIFELHPLTIIISWSPWYINNITGLWIPFFCLEIKNIKKCLALNVGIWCTPNTYNLYCRVSLNVHFCLHVCVCVCAYL